MEFWREIVFVNWLNDKRLIDLKIFVYYPDYLTYKIFVIILGLLLKELL